MLGVRPSLVVTLLVLSACSSGPLARSPGADSLRLGGADVDLCLPLPENSDYIIGDVVAENVSSGTISFVDVKLKNPQGVELIDAWLVPTAPGVDLVGVAETDQYELPAGVSKIEVGGAELKAGDELNLVLQVADTGEPGGSFDAATVSFRVDNGPEGTTDTFTSVTITKNVDRCVERA